MLYDLQRLNIYSRTAAMEVLEKIQNLKYCAGRWAMGGQTTGSRMTGAAQIPMP